MWQFIGSIYKLCLGRVQGRGPQMGKTCSLSLMGEKSIHPFWASLSLHEPFSLDPSLIYDPCAFLLVILMQSISFKAQSPCGAPFPLPFTLQHSSILSECMLPLVTFLHPLQKWDKHSGVLELSPSHHSCIPLPGTPLFPKTAFLSLKFLSILLNVLWVDSK